MTKIDGGKDEAKVDNELEHSDCKPKEKKILRPSLPLPNYHALPPKRKVYFDEESQRYFYETKSSNNNFNFQNTPDSTREGSFQFNTETFKHTSKPRFYQDFSTAIRKIEKDKPYFRSLLKKKEKMVGRSKSIKIVSKNKLE